MKLNNKGLIKMELFKMAKEAFSMRSKMNQIDKKLKSKIVNVEHKGIKIQANAKNEFISFIISEELLKEKKNKIEKCIMSALEEINKKVHNAMTEEARNLSLDMKKIL
ncbi:MAG: YbaB/EbfC family nucleoid-associated protein [Endomicrobium sp.]|jgi:DNA-binding protein YbaB|nr:YbaB/EbfC family nucleoid-associated protein [Endomicrobium sp.]